MYDVLVAGGGPAGAALAVMLGRQGRQVALFERARFPREKPCGEGLMPGGLQVLRRLGLAEQAGGEPFYGIRYYAGPLVVEGRFPRGPLREGRGQRRLWLDRALFEAAAATPGVEARQGARVEAPLLEGGRVVGLQVDGAPWRGRLVVIADGLRSGLRRQLGLDGPPPRCARVGVRAHFRLVGAAQPPAVEVFLGRGYELYVTPLPAGEVLVAALAERDALAGGAEAALAHMIASQPVLRERLAGAERVSEVQGASPLAATPRARVVPGAVLLGDAAGFIDPITGGGMSQALMSAELLASCCAEAELGASDERWLLAFDRRRQHMLRDYRLLTQFTLWLSRSAPRARLMLRIMQACPPLFSHLIGVSSGVRRLLW